jgi:ELWxxDGT repeat protein
MNGTLYFWAEDRTHGLELWKSDGTETCMVKDINPGPRDSGPVSVFPEKPVEANGFLFFKAKDNTYGYELWKTDGSEAGTIRVKDIAPGPGGSVPNYLTVVNNLVFFVVAVSHGEEIWKSDGTEEGTVLVADINPGRGGSKPRHLTNVNGTLYFNANDGLHGHELWALRQNTIMPVPTGKQHFIYSPKELPVLSSIPSEAKPIGVKSVAVDGETLEVRISLNQFASPVDIYGAYTIYSDQIRFMTPDLTFEKYPIEEIEQALATGILPDGITPSLSNIEEDVNVTLFKVPASGLRLGIHYLYLLVTPTGNFNNYYIWETYFLYPSTGQGVIEKVKGHYHHCIECSNVYPCNSAENWWVQVAPQGFLERYFEARKIPSEYSSVYVHVKGVKSELGTYGHLGASDRLFDIVEIIEMRERRENDCY